MIVRFTRQQVAGTLAILAPTMPALLCVAEQIGECPLDLAGMAHGSVAPSAKVLKFLGMVKRGKQFEWRGI